MPKVYASPQDMTNLDRAQADLLKKIRMSVDENRALSTEQKKLLREHIERLTKSFKKVINSADVRALTDQLCVFESAYYLGAYKILSQDIFKDVLKSTRRMNAITARGGRSGPQFDSYLEEIANKFWNKNKSFVDNYEGTAEKILDKVFKGIPTVQGVPPKIRNKDIANLRERKLAVRAIGQRLRKIPETHN